MNIRKDFLTTGYCYHIYSRSISKYIIFNNKDDFFRLLNILDLYRYINFSHKYSKFIELKNEMQKLINQVESDIVSSNARVEGIAESLANYHVYFGDADLINTEIEKYMRVTREDIKRAAEVYLANENRIVLYYLPKSAQQ